MIKRRTRSPESKARLVLEANSVRKTIKNNASDHAIHSAPY